MGADNLVHFDQWRGWRNIARRGPDCGYRRPGYDLPGPRGPRYGLVAALYPARTPGKELDEVENAASVLLDSALTRPPRPGSARPILRGNGVFCVVPLSTPT